MGLSPALKADLSLLGVAAIWGATFVVLKDALDDATPFALLAVRFAIATAALALIYRRAIFPTRLAPISAAALVGLFLCAGFALQTIGILDTTPSRSAFITSLYVVGVPVMAAMLRLRGLTAGTIVGVLLALTGLTLMTSGGEGLSLTLGRGEALTLVAAVMFAAHIIGVDRATQRHDPRVIAFWQIAVAGIIYVPLALWAETPRLDFTPGLIGAILVLSLGGTALAFAVQNAVQKRTTPARVAIIFTSEPVFAAITSYFVEGERLSGSALGGAALIVTGMLVSELPSASAREAA